MDLRKPFIDTLIENDDCKSVFITLDVGFSFLEPLKDKLGDRFLNLGITEQSAIVTAAALAKDYRVYVYSMIPFVLFRPFEMVRNAILIPKANVKLLGVNGSAAYAMLGYSHNRIMEDEDTRLVRPYGVEAFTPTTTEEVNSLAIKSLTSNQPMYVRL